MPQPAQQRFHHRPIPQKVGPLVIVQVRSDDRGMPAVPLLHQLEEDVRLLGPQVQVTHFVNDENIDLGQPVEKPAGG